MNSERTRLAALAAVGGTGRHFAGLCQQRGFTLIELIMVMIILGVLAVFAAPRIFNTSDFYARGFHDETLSILRYAQKAAVAQRRTVCVSFTGTTAALKMASAPATASCSIETSPAMVGPNGPPIITAKPGVSYKDPPDALIPPEIGFSTHPPTDFNFDGLGRPITGAVDASGLPVMMATQVIQVENAANVTVQGETGYVHD